MSQQKYTPNIISIFDEDGKEHLFNELDRIKNEDGQFIALIPITDNAQEENEQIIILQIVETEADNLLQPIEDEALHNKVGRLFEKHLTEIFDIK